MAGIEVEIVFDHTGEVSEALDAALALAVHEATENLAERARENAPVRTGALRDSIQTSYPEPLSGAVTVGVPYGPIEELGGADRPAHPFLGPAAEATGPEFVEDCGAGIRKATG